MPTARLTALPLALILAIAPATAQEATDWTGFVPPTDGSFSTYSETPPEPGLVKRMYQLIYTEECSWSLGGVTAEDDPDVYDLSFRYSYDTKADAEHPLRLYRFFCRAGAYNEVHVYMSWDESWGLKPLSFAQPSLQVTHVDGDAMDGAVESISINGYHATHTLVNSSFDPASQTITSHSHWRGLGDASSSGTYSFHEGSFVLTRYEADPSYDGEVNPFVIVDLSTPAPIELVPAATE